MAQVQLLHDVIQSGICWRVTLHSCPGQVALVRFEKSGKGGRLLHQESAQWNQLAGAKTSRIELRATEDDRDLLVRAAAALGTDRSSFLLAQGRLAAQRVLADREQFVLDPDAQPEWERINNRSARSLPGLMRLLERPSPFGHPTADQPQA